MAPRRQVETAVYLPFVPCSRHHDCTDESFLGQFAFSDSVSEVGLLYVAR
jgi:hypothetical protein